MNTTIFGIAIDTAAVLAILSIPFLNRYIKKREKCSHQDRKTFNNYQERVFETTCFICGDKWFTDM